MVLLRETIGFGLESDYITLMLKGLALMFEGLALSTVVFRTHAVVDRLQIQLFIAQKRVHATLFDTHCFEASLQRVGEVGARGASALGA